MNTATITAALFALIFSGDNNHGAFAGSVEGFETLALCEAAADAIYPEGWTSEGEIDDGRNFAVCVQMTE